MSRLTEEAKALEGKDTLEQIIHEIEFVAPSWKLRPYRCQNCDKIAVTHWTSFECNHLICDECYGNATANICPVCQETIGVMFQHTNFNTEVVALKAYCAFKAHGCDEIIRLDDYMKHVQHCKFSKGKAFATRKDVWYKPKIEKLTDLKIKTHFMKLEEKMEKMELQMRVMAAEIANIRPGPMIEFIHKFKNFQPLLDKHPETVKCETVFANHDYHLNVTLHFECSPDFMSWWLVASVKCVQLTMPREEQLNYRKLSITLEDQVKKGRFDITVSREQLPFETFSDWMKRFEKPLQLASTSMLHGDSPYIGQDSSIVIRLVIEAFNAVQK